jgi:hypothetical protein
VQRQLRRLLHRAFDHQPDPRHARREAGRRPLRAAGRGQSLPHFWASRAPGLLRRAAAINRDVWNSREQAIRWLDALEKATAP